MQIVLTYDINANHTLVKTEACKRGFRDYVMTTNNERKQLPNTVLLGDFDSATAAVEAFKAVIRNSAPSSTFLERIYAAAAGAGHVEQNR